MEATFENLPKALQQLSEKINGIEVLLLEYYDKSAKKESDRLLTVKQASEFLNLAVPTIYSKISRCELPYMKRSKRIYFSELELINYIKAGKRKTIQEIKNEADESLNLLKK